MTPSSTPPSPRARLAAFAALAGIVAAGAAVAQSPPSAGEAVATAGSGSLQAPPAAAPSAVAETPSESMVINLIRLLVKQGVITQAAADSLKAQAEAEAQQARLAAAQAPLGANLPPPAPGVVRVPYVPLIVRNQIRDEVKQDVMAQAQAEGWAAKNAVPEWVNHITWSGDFRFRDQFNFYSSHNAPDFIDFAALNANGPVDLNPLTNAAGPPILNSRVNNLNQLSLRARLAVTADIVQGVSATVRIASGNDNSPVSTTQLLGGGLTKKDIWLDQAYLQLRPTNWSTLQFGRLPNPFFYTDLVFDDNLNFDGAAAKVSAPSPFGPAGLGLFASGGAFPLEYVSGSFPTNSQIKAGDRTKWLFAVQGGAQYQPDPAGWSVKGAVAYYDFFHVAGIFSNPCALFDGNTQCDTDFTRPAFMQKGNTLFELRDILANPSLSPGLTPTPQFVGLAYDYHVLDTTAAFEMPLFGGQRLLLTGDFAHNFGYTPGHPAGSPINNFGPCSSPGCVGPYQSGDNAFMARLLIGNPRPGLAGDWNVTVGYKYIEPDAVLDAFNDHDFHAGGTNAKGYFVYASYFFAKQTWADVRWYSANEVFGPPLAIDILQLELNTRF